MPPSAGEPTTTGAPIQPRGGPTREALGQLITVTREGPPRRTYRITIPSHFTGADARPVDVELRVQSFWALLSLLGLAEWLGFALLAALFSAALWWPFVWGISHALRRLTTATQCIAEGRFDTRVISRRPDELGQLAAAVNRMAERLQGQASAQRQFVADVAHEVTSPLARLKLGLELLEPALATAPAGAAQRFADVQDDAQQMADLLQELLLFSRAGLQASERAPEQVALDDLLRDVLEREDPQHAVQNRATPGLTLVTHARLLERALANLVRNALRYGEQVEVGARIDGDALLLSVADRGPGVPEDVLGRLGEPFYRPEVARSRDTGGTGLGLAIVRRCIESCGGKVSLANREGGGFLACVRLPRRGPGTTATAALD